MFHPPSVIEMEPLSCDNEPQHEDGTPFELKLSPNGIWISASKTPVCAVQSATKAARKRQTDIVSSFWRRVVLERRRRRGGGERGE